MWRDLIIGSSIGVALFLMVMALVTTYMEDDTHDPNSSRYCDRCKQYRGPV